MSSPSTIYPGLITSENIQNLGLSTSISAGALTIWLTQATAFPPTVFNPVIFPFYTSLNGISNNVNRTSSLSITIPASATLAFNANTQGYIYVYAVLNGANLILCVSGQENGSDYGELVTPTIISSSSNLDYVLYSASAGGTNVPVIQLGRVKAESALPNWSNVTELSVLRGKNYSPLVNTGIFGNKKGLLFTSKAHSWDDTNKLLKLNSSVYAGTVSLTNTDNSIIQSRTSITGSALNNTGSGKSNCILNTAITGSATVVNILGTSSNSLILGNEFTASSTTIDISSANTSFIGLQQLTNANAGTTTNTWVKGITSASLQRTGTDLTLSNAVLIDTSSLVLTASNGTSSFTDLCILGGFGNSNGIAKGLDTIRESSLLGTRGLFSLNSPPLGSVFTNSSIIGGASSSQIINITSASSVSTSVDNSLWLNSTSTLITSTNSVTSSNCFSAFSGLINVSNSVITASNSIRIGGLGGGILAGAAATCTMSNCFKVGGTIGGLGSSTTANCQSSGIIGGLRRASSGNITNSVLIGGNDSAGNVVSGSTNAVALGGTDQLSSIAASNFVILGGQNSILTLQSIIGTPASQFTSTNVCSGFEVNLRVQTTDATPTNMTIDGDAASGFTRLVLANNHQITFSAQIVAGGTASTNAAGITIEGVIKKGTTAATTSLVGTPTKVTYKDAGFAAVDVNVLADTTNGALLIQVTGIAATTINWVCKLQAVALVS